MNQNIVDWFFEWAVYISSWLLLLLAKQSPFACINLIPRIHLINHLSDHYIALKHSMPKTFSQLLRKLSRERFRITIPTILTFLRLVLAPFIVIAMIWQQWGAAFWLFSIAAFTDMLDGFLARRWNQRTFFGACLDPIADKFLLLSVFFTLAFVSTPLFSIPRWFFWFVLAKELLQVLGAFAIYRFKGNLEIRATLLGKLTTVVQMGFILWLFACYFFHWMPIKTYSFMVGLLFMLVLATLVHYGTIGWRFVKGS